MVCFSGDMLRSRLPVALFALVVTSLAACHEAPPLPRDPASAEPRVWADTVWNAQQRASACARPGMPEGRGRVDVVLDPDGQVISADLSVAPYKDTPVGDCVLSVAKEMKLPASHRQMKTQLRVVVGHDTGSWLHPGELDRFDIDEQTRIAVLRMRRDCMRILPPDLHANLSFDPATGRVAEVDIESKSLGGVRPCMESKLREINVPAFEGDGNVRVRLSQVYDWHYSRSAY
jgi:hypothetical protein